MRVEVDLPSGVRARVVATERCAVVEANGIASYAPCGRNVAADVALELAGLLAELRVEPDDRNTLDGLG
jgi:hypothetical protein